MSGSTRPARATRAPRSPPGNSASHGVPHTVIADNAGGHLMQHGEVDLAIVGTDRVTRTRRRRQQDRHLSEGAGGARQRRAVLGRAALHHDRLDASPTASRRSRSRNAPPPRSPTSPAAPRTDRIATVRIVTPAAARRANPAFDVTPAAGDRADHRARPLCGERGGTAGAVSRTAHDRRLRDRSRALLGVPLVTACPRTRRCRRLPRVPYQSAFSAPPCVAIALREWRSVRLAGR